MACGVDGFGTPSAFLKGEDNAMDIQRPEFARRRRIRFAVISAILLLICSGLAYALYHLKPAAICLLYTSIPATKSVRTIALTAV